MNLRRLALPSAFFAYAFLALACLALPASADPLVRASNLRSDILYTHRGEFVQVSPMRPLTLNAHVEQFQYDPLGLEIALVGSEPQGENTVHFVKTVDVRTGHEISRFAVTSTLDDPMPSLFLLGWSASGKYLLLQEFSSDPRNPGQTVTEYLRWDLSSNPPALQALHPEALLPTRIVPEPDPLYTPISPDKHWIVFQEVYYLPDANGTKSQKRLYLLYDVEKNTFRSLDLPDGTDAYSWYDNGHLKMFGHHLSSQYDVITGQISLPPTTPDSTAPAVSQQYPDLSLDAEQRDLNDLKGNGGHVPSWIVWIRRTPFGKMPLGSAAAGVMPSRPQADAPYENDPQAAWSPTGKQVAFIANGDLCVSNLTTATDLLPHEKMAVGLKLTCQEEQQLAMSNLKQIGLALIQYTQDFDEHFPPTKDIEQTLAPYLKTSDVFSVGNAHWVYHGVGNASLASIDAPADTVEATMDLPCAHLVLFFDGHVKAFPKQETTP